MNNTIVIVEDLHKIYDNKVHAVRGISFKVRKGEIFGLIGPNGAGKSTTLRMIVGLIRPTRGRIRVMGIDVVKHPVEIKKYIGYLPEEADVYERLTGLEHLRFYAMLRGLTSSELEKTIEYGIKLSGLEQSALKRRASESSKGMKRRLLLASVLMTRPKLAILDEPTSGLDVYASVNVRKMIKKYVEETGASIILSSHNMLEVEYLCDRVAFIAHGKIIVEAEPDRIKQMYDAVNLEEAFVKAVKEADRM